MTGDLAVLAVHDNIQKADTFEFIKEIRKTLEEIL